MTEKTEEPWQSPATARRGKRRRILVSVGVLGLLVVVGGVGLTHVVATTRAANAGPEPAKPPATATVTRTDLVDQLRFTATVGHGAGNQVVGHKPGVLTWLPEPGTVVRRGEPLYRVDADQVPLFIGVAPLYRQLARGVPPGQDVELVQRNLAELGFEVAVDGVFGPATERAVRAWQARLGVAQTGVVEPADVVVRTSQVRVATLSAQLGDPADGPLMTVTNTRLIATASVTAAGQRLLAPGTAVTMTATGTDDELTGTVHSLTPDQETGTDTDTPQQFIASITFDDRKAAAGLTPGTTVRVVAEAERAEQVLAVPVGALLALLDGGYAVEVVEGERHRLLPVRTGMFADGLVEVSGAGLTEGMTVVVAS